MFRLLKLRFNQFNLREISDKNYFVMLNVLTGKMSFVKTLIGKNLGQIRKSVNPIGCLKRASEKQCLSMRKPALVRRRTVCNIYDAARYCS